VARLGGELTRDVPEVYQVWMTLEVETSKLQLTFEVNAFFDADGPNSTLACIALLPSAASHQSAVEFEVDSVNVVRSLIFLP
jgi:hypothetical protein